MTENQPEPETSAERASSAPVTALTLNGPVEVGTRALMILVESFPDVRTLDHLILLDHGVLHSADWGGPTSLHPPLPQRVGELGVRRDAVLAGLQLMVRVRLAEPWPIEAGIGFRAKDAAQHFTDVLVSSHARALRASVRWSVQRFGPLSTDDQRSTLRELLGTWSSLDGIVSQTMGEGEER